MPIANPIQVPPAPGASTAAADPAPRKGSTTFGVAASIVRKASAKKERTHKSANNSDDEDEEVARRFFCELCPKAFPTRSKVRRHCIRQFSLRVLALQLHRHLVVHSRDKPYTCGACGKGFSQKASMTHHTKTSCSSAPRTPGDDGEQSPDDNDA